MQACAPAVYVHTYAGKFGWHSWLIFCRDMGRTLKCEDAALVSYANWRKKQPIVTTEEEADEEEAEVDAKAGAEAEAQGLGGAAIAVHAEDTKVKVEAGRVEAVKVEAGKAVAGKAVADVPQAKATNDPKEEESSSEDEAQMIRRLQKEARK